MEDVINEIQKDQTIQADLMQVDFWYEFTKQYDIIMKRKTVLESNASKIKLVADNETKPEYWIEFTLDTGTDQWRIKSNLQILRNKVSYSNSKGLGIMEYLVNECKYPKKISAKTLVNLINQRFPKKTKEALYKFPEKSLGASVRASLIKISNKILHLVNQFEFYNECCYNPKSNYEFKFIRPKSKDLKNI